MCPQTIDIQTLINWHLQIDPITLPKGDTLYSTLTTPLKEVRELVLRTPDTGDHLNNNESSSWIAAKGYLALIEQLGNAYEIEPVETERNNFKRSLKMFSDLNEENIEILWGLRCSFFHDFALVRNDGHPRYIFNVGPRGTSTNFIRSSAGEWNGTVPADGNLRPFVTTIDLNGIGALFEEVIYPRVSNLAGTEALQIRQLSLQEFQLKYFWMIAPQR